MSLFAAPDRLNRLQIEITTGCNLRCAGCQRTLGMAAGRWTNSHMSVENFRRVVLNAPPAAAVVLQGIGEPTLHPHLPELITIARDSAKFGQISFNTNALACEPDYFAGLRTLGLGHISISVDSLVPATAEALRAGTDVRRLYQAIAALIPIFEGRITLSVVLSRRNLDELSGLLAELARLGAMAVEIQPLVSYAPEIAELTLRPEDRETTLRMVAEARSRFPRLSVLLAPALTANGSRCRRPFRAAYVTVTGLLTPCCLTQDARLYGLTGILDQSYAAAWASPGVSGWLDRYLDHTPEICKGCCYNPSGDNGTAADGRAVLDQSWRDFSANKLDQADQALTRLLADGVSVEALHRLGLSALRRNQPAKALPLLQAAAMVGPSPQILNNLASVQDQLGQRDAARALLVSLVNQHPDYEPGYRSLIRLLLALDQRKDAMAVITRLVRRGIDSNNRALVERQIAPMAELADDIDGLLLTGNLLRTAGWADLAGQLLEKIRVKWPDHLGAMLTACMAMLPQGYHSMAEIQRVRDRYHDALQNLAAVAERADAATLAAAAPQLGQAKPFFLSYQGEDDRALQELYGRIVSRIAAAADSAPVALAPPPAAGERIRVGFVSGYFRLHSVSKLFAGWITQMDKAGFELFGYDLSDRPMDPWGQRQMDACDHRRSGHKDDQAWIAAIAADRLHAVIYPELGMDPMAARLACRRLAPVQAVAWGHPVTSGLPSIDYFLSSELMEPPGADAHYTERLIRLPNLSLYYNALPQGHGSLSRQTMGLRPDGLVFICCQSLFKYRPGEDELFIRIAQALPKAQFLFIGGAGLARTEVFRQRLSAAFAVAGLDAARHLVFTEPVPGPLFPALLRLGDIYLDSLVWSGGNTSLEAATEGLPIITQAGPLMRSRHTAAILQVLGLEEWVAQDLDSLVALAVRLADPVLRQEAAVRMAERRSRLFGDETPVRALEEFLRRAVSQGA